MNNYRVILSKKNATNMVMTVGAWSENAAKDIANERASRYGYVAVSVMKKD